MVLVNNNDKCSELLEGLTEMITEKLSPDDVPSLDMNPPTTAFHTAVNVAINCLCKTVFQDLEETLQKILEPPWFSKEVTEPVLSCIDSYLENDFKVRMSGCKA